MNYLREMSLADFMVFELCNILFVLNTKNNYLMMNYFLIQAGHGLETLMES